MSSGITAIEHLKDGEGLGPTSVGISSKLNAACPFCGKNGEFLYTGVADWLYAVPGSWGTRKCSSCEVIWLDPQPVAKEIPKLYSSYCTHDASPSLTRIGQLQQEVSQCALARLGYPVDAPKKLIPQLLSHLPFAKRVAALSVLDLPASERGTLLDVGCGNGEFMGRMHSFGWNVSGLDFDPSAASYARGQGLDVRYGTIADLPDSVRYDVIVLSHVIEHVSDPVDLLRECGKRLQPGTGRLVISTPNINSLGHASFKDDWRGLEVPRHFILYSPAGLRECVARAGLTLRSISTETRLAQMIYSHSACAKAGERGVAERIKFKISTRIAARLFRMMEDLMVHLKKDVGEEILCVCAAPRKA